MKTLLWIGSVGNIEKLPLILSSREREKYKEATNKLEKKRKTLHTK